MKNIKLVFFFLAIFAIFNTGYSQQKYAIIITGDNNAINVPANDQWNNGQGIGNFGYDEFWNDTYLFWEMLYTQKGYLNENIYVLYDEGIDLSFPGQADRYNALVTYNFNITDQAATLSNIQGILTTLAGTITKNDFLFVWIMSHGGADAQGSYFYSYDAQKIYDTQLATWLDGIDAYKKTVFISCPSSNGFTEKLENKRTIVLASSDDGEEASRADDQSNSGAFIEKNYLGHKDSGVHGYMFQNSSLQNGLYFYSLVVNGVITDTKKMIVQN